MFEKALFQAFCSLGTDNIEIAHSGPRGLEIPMLCFRQNGHLLGTIEASKVPNIYDVVRKRCEK